MATWKLAESQYPQADRDEVYALLTPQIVEAFERWKLEYGTWRGLAEAMRCSQRHLRYVRALYFKTIGWTVLERWTMNIGKEWYLRGLDWYTVDELLEMGLWRPMIDVGHEFPGGLPKDQEEGRWPLKGWELTHKICGEGGTTGR